MLRNWTPHSEYQKAIFEFIINYNDRNRLQSFDKSISKLYLLNLDKVYDVIESCYPNLGRPAKNQQAIIRSFILMLDQTNNSVTRWAEKVQYDELLSTICGFEGKASGVASYYDFLDRLWLNNDKYSNSEKSKLKPYGSKPKKKLKQNEKLPPKHPGSVARLVDKAKLDKLRTRSLEKFMQLIMKVCVVIPSAERGLLGDVKALAVAFDGTPYYSGASPYGSKVCKCKENGVYACKCDRKFSDPDARWGWDSYRKQWFYGNTLFNVSAADSDYDLPIFF